LRRAVPGRIKDFDSLLLEHRERVNIAKEQQLLSKAQNLTSSSAGNSGNKFSDPRYFIVLSNHIVVSTTATTLYTNPFFTIVE
jgi:hypothetical protein